MELHWKRRFFIPKIPPWCRCCTAPYFADMEGIGKRWSRNPDTGKGELLPADSKFFDWKEKYVKPKGSEKGLTNGGENDIMEMGSDDVTISSIDSPIEQKHTGKGNPNAILIFDVELNNRQQQLLDALPNFDSRITVPKKSVNMADLSALTAKTGDEFAMFTNKDKRFVIRGNEYKVNVTVAEATALADQGYRWSGHTHPGTDPNVKVPSQGDKEILKCFPQEFGVIYDSKGNYRTFEKE